MKKYELVYIIHPDLEGSIEKVTEKVRTVIKKANGTIITEEDWGKKKLAYEIKKNKTGVYQFLVVEIESEGIKEVERVLRLSEEIIRSMIVVSEEDAFVAPSKVRRETTKKTDEKATEDPVKEEIEGIKVKSEEKEESQKVKAEGVKEEKERLKELDEKLKEIIGPDES